MFLISLAKEIGKRMKREPMTMKQHMEMMKKIRAHLNSLPEKREDRPGPGVKRKKSPPK